jgi:hypothetical protein
MGAAALLLPIIRQNTAERKTPNNLENDKQKCVNWEIILRDFWRHRRKKRLVAQRTF